MLNQTFELHDLVVIGFLVVLEGVLSIDNALVLGLLARRVPKHQQGRALTYGLVGAVVFRFIAIALAQYVMHWQWAKLVGGGYLIYISLKYFISEATDKTDEKFVVGKDQAPDLIDEATGKALSPEQIDDEISARVPIPIPEREDGDVESSDSGRGATASAGGISQPVIASPSHIDDATQGTANFWWTVAVIELTDIAFAIDSLLAAIAMVGEAPKGHIGLHPKFWVVLSGGLIGVALMRIAAVMFIKLLEKFPRLEVSAYLLVIVIGVKLCLEYFFHWDFHSPTSPAFILFWSLMVLSFLVGFVPKKHVERVES